MHQDPFSYEEEGEFKGLTRELLESGLSHSGLELEYYKLENRKEAQASLQNGEIDILAYCVDTEEVLATVSFLLNQEDRNRQVKIMRGIVKLSEELEAQIVCEGVETEEDVNLMKEIGAYVAQGYFYSKPVPEADFEEKLETMT